MSDEKDILSIDSDDDNLSYLALSKHLTEDTDRKKNLIFNEIELLGDDLLEEIDEKKTIKEIEKDKLIEYILKKSKKKYSLRQLKSYSYEDVKNIFDEVKIENRPFIAKMFRFIFNL